MSSIEHLYTRRGHVIFDEKTNARDDCKSINAAKRKSREIQLKNGGLGRGSVKVGPPLKKQRKS